MNFYRNIKLPDLIESALLLPKTDIGKKKQKNFFSKIGKILYFCDFKNGGCIGIRVAAWQP